MVNSITVTFDGAAILDPGAIELRRQDGTPGGRASQHLAGERQDGGCAHLLRAGVRRRLPGRRHRYTLTVLADRVHDRWGRELDGDGDGDAGGDRVDRFHRLFGDADGDGDVDGLDRDRFRAAFGTTEADTGYLWYFDFDGDGDVDGRDNGQFNRRFGQS